MARFGTEKPVVFLAEAQTITGWAQNGTEIDITIATPNVVADDHIRIESTPEYDGYYDVTAVSGSTVTIDATWSGSPTANGTGRKCWDMNLDDTMVYYVPDYQNAVIINESPINGHISKVNLADDTDEGRFKLDLTLNNLSTAQHDKLLETIALDPVPILIHRDDTVSLGIFNFVLINYKEFAGANYPLVDNAILKLETADYEQIK
jgi:hypothetical protein